MNTSPCHSVEDRKQFPRTSCEGHLLRFACIQQVLIELPQYRIKAVCESTGGYERLVVGKLREAAINVQVAHPLRVRSFARACGYEAKTDPLDAQVLSRFGVVFSGSDTEQTEVEPEREELRQLLSRRGQLVEQRVRERNRLEEGVSGSVGKSIRRNIRWLDREIERLDEEYKELLKHSLSLSETVELYKTVPGVGRLTAATLVAFLPELGMRDGKSLISLVGLAPWSRDSGKSAAIGPFEAVVARCAGRCISVPGWCSASKATCATSISVFGSAASPIR